jgi:hypothetical protein
VATIFITFLLDYNLTEPDYNLPEPNYNLPELSLTAVVKIPERVVVGIRIFTWTPNYINKNSGKKINENFIRRSVKILKLHSGFILTKKRRY